MKIIHSVEQLRAALHGMPSVSLVPTMGNLHEGHLSLVRRAQVASGVVVTSIFVNPLQFSPSDDFATYPRTLDADCALLKQAGCDLVFAPTEREMYPVPQRFVVTPPASIANVLEGEVRPGFFTGVCTVVLKLFNLVRPNRAYFGKKDFQQLLIVGHMIRELALDVECVAVETVREPSGLARSSRNSYLTDRERAQASELHAALQAVVEEASRGRTDWTRLEDEARARLAINPAWSPDYVAIRRRADLGPPGEGTPLVVLGAARLGTTRLIDNVEF